VVALPEYALHRLGWKAFQDLCVALVEEQMQRPVQTFLPTNDAGRDGAFLGRWDTTVPGSPGESTIQCKFTSKRDHNLSLSMLSDELPKAKRLAQTGLADDYIILTNHPVTGESELRIKKAFQAVGVGRCRVFHRDWIIQRIHESARLRMMVPRLYGLVDLTDLLDLRTYRQAQLILSEMGDNLQKLVVTESHRKSVRAISKHNLVLLLGSPAAGKSTIGASLALGATDIWKCSTIKSSSPEHLERHLDPKGGQFFWVDDAWGSTQYQRERTEAWNQIFPLMQGALKKGTRFLITSRDYIWQSARKELKLQALPVLNKSQVIINVHELTTEEKARILYNHVKLGDQSATFRRIVKPFLPALAKREDFLPESARRLGTELFTENLRPTAAEVADFFERPREFLEQTIESLASECRAAIALVFLNGGHVKSPVPREVLEKPASAFGVTPATLRAQLEALNGSLLNLAEDEEGPYWTYRHPTIGDAFASYVAKSPELIEIYLGGATAETIVREVVCAGIQISGAPVVVPNGLHELLADRIASLPSYILAPFISYRSNVTFTKRLLEARPDIWKRLDDGFIRPLSDDTDAGLFATLHRQGLLPEEKRLDFVEEIRAAAIEDADDSFLDDSDIASVLTTVEHDSILNEVKEKVLDRFSLHVSRVRRSWGGDYDPADHFDELRSSVRLFAEALSGQIDKDVITKMAEKHIKIAIEKMEELYEPPSSSTTPIQQSAAKADSLEEMFRDIDE
jgi:hypothetical protein